MILLGAMFYLTVSNFVIVQSTIRIRRTGVNRHVKDVGMIAQILIESGISACTDAAPGIGEVLNKTILLDSLGKYTR